MKKTIVLGLVTVGLVAGVWSYAADNPDPADKGRHMSPQEQVEKRIEHLKSTLSLTADQETKVRAALKTMREKIKAIRDETDNAIAALLTAEQKVKFEAMKEKRPKQVPGK